MRRSPAPPRPLVRSRARRTRCCAFGDDRGFWATLAAPDVSRVGAAPSRALTADDARLDRIAEAFARVIDAKSPYTARHSERVAEIAVGIGARARLRPRHAARPAPRGAAARHRQARRSPTASSTSRARSRDEEFAQVTAHPRSLAADPRARVLLRRDSPRSPPPTTSGSTARGYPCGLAGAELDLADARARGRRRLRGADRRPPVPRGARAPRRRSRSSAATCRTSWTRRGVGARGARRRRAARPRGLTERGPRYVRRPARRGGRRARARVSAFG